MYFRMLWVFFSASKGLLARHPLSVLSQVTLDGEAVRAAALGAGYAQNLGKPLSTSPNQEGISRKALSTCCASRKPPVAPLAETRICWNQKGALGIVYGVSRRW